MREDEYGTIWSDPPEAVEDDPELDVDEVSGAEELEEAAPAEPAVDEAVGVVYTRGPNGRLIQAS